MRYSRGLGSAIALTTRRRMGERLFASCTRSVRGMFEERGWDRRLESRGFPLTSLIPLPCTPYP